MKEIFPVNVEELASGDTYVFQDLRDLRIFIEENADILDEFSASSAEGHTLRLTKDILDSDNLGNFVDENHKK